MARFPGGEMTGNRLIDSFWLLMVTRLSSFVKKFIRSFLSVCRESVQRVTYFTF